jgi:class 3 adenylate cyclase
VAKAEARAAENQRDRYGLYLDPTLRTALSADADADALALRQQQLAICVWDITGYSAVAETASAQRQLADVIRQFFTLAVEATTDHHGIVHKFLGDGVIAVFPPPRTTHPRTARAPPLNAPPPPHCNCAAATGNRARRRSPRPPRVCGRRSCGAASTWDTCTTGASTSGQCR